MKRSIQLGVKGEDKDGLLFQRLLWGAVAGCLLALCLGQSPYLESLELAMLQGRYQLADQWRNWTGQMPLQSDIKIIAFDDFTQFELGIARFNDQRSQVILSQCLSQIEKAKPALVVVDLDLRGAANPDLVRVFSRHRNVVIGLFGSLEGSTDLPDLEFMSHAAAYGGSKLPRESDGAIFRLPLNYEDKGEDNQGGITPLPSLTEAVIDVYRRVKGVGPASQFMSLLPKQTVYVNFQSRTYPTESLQALLLPGFDFNQYRDKIVLIGSILTPRHDDPMRCKTPLAENVPEIVVQADAISTLLDNRVIFSFSKTIAGYFVILLGAAAGALSSALRPSVRLMFYLLGLLVLLGAAQFSFQFYHVAIPVVPSLAVLTVCFIAGTVIYLDCGLRQRNRELAQARAAMQERAEEERRRIADDLHDETLPTLSAVARMADRLGQDLEGNPVPKQMRERLDSAVAEMRRVINDLHPSVLETMGFVPALESLLSNCSAESNLAHEFVDRIGDENCCLDWFTKLQLYRIVQEALNNVVKHAHASQVCLALEQRQGHLVISVADDGGGIDQRQVRQDSRGLINIKQRAQLIGAVVAWEVPARFCTGTELKVEIRLG